MYQEPGLSGSDPRLTLVTRADIPKRKGTPTYVLPPTNSCNIITITIMLSVIILTAV